jgi:hypothetical protein
MNYGTIRKITNTPNSNPSSIGGIYSRACEYEIHRLCQEQILKQRQRKSSHTVSYRYLKNRILLRINNSERIVIICVRFINKNSACSHQQHYNSNMFPGRRVDDVVAADVNRMNWLVGSGLSSFVTTTVYSSIYARKTIRDGAVAMAWH